MKVWDLRKCKQVVIPEGVERIGSCWFWGSGVESITIAASVREIGAEAFYNCRNLRHVAFAPGSKLEKIESDCFCNSRIERVAIPKGVVEIREGVFKDCGSLKEVVFEAGSVLKKIGDDAFYWCESLKNIQFPDSLEVIGIGCFYNSGLEKIVFPAGVK